MSQTFLISAPLCVVLFGDYVLTTNRPCLAVPLTSKITIRVDTLPQKQYFVSIPSLEVLKWNMLSPKPSGKAHAVIHLLSTVYRQFDELPGMHITVLNEYNPDQDESVVPLTTCFVKAVLKVTGIKLKKPEIYDAVLQVLNASKKQPLGPDIAVAIWKKTLYYHNQAKERVIIPTKSTYLPVTTKVLNDLNCIVGPLSWWKHHKRAVEQALQDISTIVEDSISVIERADWQELGRLMNKHQKLLQDLELSTEDYHQECVQAMLAGALGAKLSLHPSPRVVLLEDKTRC